jgi:hypothetical protein
MNRKQTQLQIITEALGEASALFMSQEVLGTKIIMPSEELIKIAEKTVEKINEI